MSNRALDSNDLRVLRAIKAGPLHEIAVCDRDLAVLLQRWGYLTISAATRGCMLTITAAGAALV